MAFVRRVGDIFSEARDVFKKAGDVFEKGGGLFFAVVFVKKTIRENGPFSDGSFSG